MSDVLYDVIVVGAGVVGSWTAYHLAKQGKKTLVLEQFPQPHSRGSSHGQSRIIRKAYTQVHYAHMMVEAYPLWLQLEEETGSQLYKETGMLMIGEAGGEALRRTEDALRSVRCRHETLSPVQLRTRFPMMTFGSTTGAILDHEAGILHADRCLAKIQEVYLKHGGTLYDGEKVLDIRPGAIVQVETPRGRYRARSVVLATGPWAAQLTSALGLTLPVQPVCVNAKYWQQQTGEPGRHGVGSMPAFIVPGSHHNLAGGSRTEHVDVYGIPANEYSSHAKICMHGGVKIDPDARDSPKAADWQADELEKFVHEHFPGLEAKPSIIEKCIYTLTPDEDFILDKHPTWNNIVVGAGFSGHGFKLAPVVGKVLAEMSQGKTPSYNMQPFRMNRFSQKSNL